MSYEPYYYKLGTEVLFYWKDRWLEGTIINGYRSKDGIINIELKMGTKVWCGEARHKEFIKKL